MYGSHDELLRRGRTHQLLTSAFIVFAILLGRLLILDTFQSARYRELSEENRARLVRARAPRGLIFDRQGMLLAGNRPSFSLIMAPADVARHPETIGSLALLTGRPDSLFRAALGSGRGARYEPVCLMRDLAFPILSRLEERNSMIPGSAVEVEPLREYPWGPLTAHLVGYTGEVSEKELEEDAGAGYRRGDYRGRSGVERMCEKFVRGRDGGRFIEVNALGKELGEITDKPAIAPHDGDRLILALDMGLQKKAQEVLEAAGQGAIVALDPRNGDLLALAASPSFDPNLFSGGVPAADWARLNNDPARPLLNRAVSGLFPPGSTFKVAMAAMALETGVIRPDELMRPCTGGYRYGNRIFHCWKAGGHGSLPLRKALANSCDVYFYQLGQRLTLETMARYMREWGAVDLTGSAIPGEVKGLFPDPEWLNRRYGPNGWSRSVELNLAIGQGEVLFTPLGLARLVGGIVNNGEMAVPRVWLRVETPEGRLVEENPPRFRSMHLAPATTEIVREGLAMVVTEGTAHGAALPGIAVGGKTGTAQNPHGKDHAWFVGFAPVENPEIVVLALVEQGGHGGATAAPLVKRVMAAHFGITLPEDAALQAAAAAARAEPEVDAVPAAPAPAVRDQQGGAR